MVRECFLGYSSSRPWTRLRVRRQPNSADVSKARAGWRCGVRTHVARQGANPTAGESSVAWAPTGKKKMAGGLAPSLPRTTASAQQQPATPMEGFAWAGPLEDLCRNPGCLVTWMPRLLEPSTEGQPGPRESRRLGAGSSWCWAALDLRQTAKPPAGPRGGPATGQHGRPGCSSTEGSRGGRSPPVRRHSQVIRHARR